MECRTPDSTLAHLKYEFSSSVQLGRTHCPRFLRLLDRQLHPARGMNSPTDIEVHVREEGGGGG
jgi:hypothetical protein